MQHLRAGLHVELWQGSGPPHQAARRSLLLAWCTLDSSPAKPEALVRIERSVLLQMSTYMLQTGRGTPDTFLDSAFALICNAFLLYGIGGERKPEGLQPMA